MAIIWQKKVNGVLHEIRSAGSSVRLYTDGVFHSQFNPRHPAGGHVWDLLMLPAFFLQPEKVRRILVLGAGGGAVMRQLNYFTQAEVIIGIDNNRWHHGLARKYFGIRGRPFRLIRDDAVNWVSEYSGDSFDLVIDDLYGEQDGEPSRAVAADVDWFVRLYQLLSENGLLVINFLDRQHLGKSGWTASADIRKLFASAFRLSMDNYENIIGVYCKAPVLRADFKKRLQNYPELDRRRKTCKLNYTMRALA